MMLRLRRTELTGLHTGSQRRKSKKMALLREKNGSTHPATSAIGATTVRKASVSNTTKMVISTKECGRLISATARELTGASRQKNCVVNTLVTGLKTRSTAVVHSSTKMKIATMATG
jgi:hypothetical protein